MSEIHKHQRAVNRAIGAQHSYANLGLDYDKRPKLILKLMAKAERLNVDHLGRGENRTRVFGTILDETIIRFAAQKADLLELAIDPLSNSLLTFLRRDLLGRDMNKLLGWLNGRQPDNKPVFERQVENFRNAATIVPDVRITNITIGQARALAAYDSMGRIARHSRVCHILAAGIIYTETDGFKSVPHHAATWEVIADIPAETRRLDRFREVGLRLTAVSEVSASNVLAALEDPAVRHILRHTLQMHHRHATAMRPKEPKSE